MTREQLENLMADYLGGELPDAQRQEFKAALQDHPDLVAEVDSLKDTLRTMRQLDGFAPSTHGQTVDDAVSESAALRRQSSTRWKLVAMRYAAAILLAFTAGYFVRSPIESDHRDNSSIGGIPNHVVEQYAREAKTPSLSRSLLLLSRAARGEGPASVKN